MGPVRHAVEERKAHIRKTSPYNKNESGRGDQDDVVILEDLGLPKNAGSLFHSKASGSKKRKESSREGQGKSGWTVTDMGTKFNEEEQVEGLDRTGKQDVKVDDQAEEEKHVKNESTGSQSDRGAEAAEMVDYYKVLEVPRNATVADIKKSYRRLALRWHPDKNPDNQQEATVRFREVSEAYEVLIDEKKRKIYDQYGKEGLINGGRPTSNGRGHGDDFGFGFGSPFSFGFGFQEFTFRDPEEVFREFFRGDPLADLMDSFFDGGSLFAAPRSRSNQRGQRGTSGSSRAHTQNSLSTNFFTPLGFGFGGPMISSIFQSHDSFGDGDFFSTTTFGSASAGAPPAVKRTSTSTRFQNGKKIVTKKVIENGIETVTVTENGVVKTKTVNGVPQAIGY